MEPDRSRTIARLIGVWLSDFDSEPSRLSFKVTSVSSRFEMNSCSGVIFRRTLSDAAAVSDSANGNAMHRRQVMDFMTAKDRANEFPVCQPAVPRL